MAPAAKHPILNNGTNLQRDRQPMGIRTGGAAAVASPTPSPLSKAERLLGVADTSGMSAQLSRTGSGTSRRTQKRGNVFTSTFSDLKGALSGATRYASRSRRAPTSSAFPTTNDSDSVTSVTSPTFGTSNSASTLPSYHEPPMSPYFSHRGSESPSSPREVDARHDYHAALTHGRYKVPSDMPSISEHFGREDQSSRHELPPLEMPPLTISSKPGTPKTMSSFAPINRLRSPSALSVASESTAKARFFGRRSSRHLSREAYLDYPSSPSTEHHLPSAHMPIPPMPTTKADSTAIEQWLARADLARRPSTTSTATRSTVPRKVQATLFSSGSSQMSLKTLTTQKETATAQPHSPRPPNLRAVRSSDELDNFAVAMRQPGIGGPAGRDLQIESVLSLSSSEDEEDDRIPKPRDGNEKGSRGDRQDTAPNPTAAPRTNSFASSTTAPQFLEMQRQEIIRKKSEKSGPKRRAPPVISPPRNNTSKASFGSVDWQGDDEDDSDSWALEASEKLHPALTGELGRKTGHKTDSLLLSPTSKVMVVSKREEKLLAQMREGKRNTFRSSTTDSEGTSPSAPPTPIISVSPPRRTKRTKAIEGVDEMLELSENRVITFPSPPTLPPIGIAGSRASSMSLALSKAALSDLSGLPDAAGSEDKPPPLPTGTILSPSSASQASPNHSVSAITDPSSPQQPNSSDEDTTRSAAPHELPGSTPVTATNMPVQRFSKRDLRRSGVPQYTTGLEARQDEGLEELEELELEDDFAAYIRAAVL